ncbi:hypothetical protein KKF05_01275 [Patescibacteria group bacterium]|nr:hypothetical protein [Patescibacteria group bacterium]MBU1028924.1 hypothetical protein [Patescibacteria group bacterium]
MGKKGLIKLLAAGALVGAVVHMINKVEDKDKKKAALTKAANKVGQRVSGHAKKMGQMTKAHFEKIIDTVVKEFTDAKDLSKDELDSLRTELKSNWKEVKDVFAKKPSKKSKK